MAQKPSIPKGTRDFLPEQMIRRNYIFDTIRRAFVKYGYLPIETPAMEKAETLLGKYGEEGDRLIFKILPRGEKYNKFMESQDPKMVEEALRYDLTVPFARYVVQHRNDITLPFKRYQIQPVWRADRPQRGRYREFYQCDADVVGSDSLLYEVELIQLIDEVFKDLNVPHKIYVNNRKILQGMVELVGIEDRAEDVFVTLDKFDKIGNDIYDELLQKDFDPSVVGEIRSFMTVVTEAEEGDRINKIEELFARSNVKIGLEGISEVREIFDTLIKLRLEDEKLPNVTLRITLARGLNYYTGAIFEVAATQGDFTPSILGGGRYDDLTGLFGMAGVSGVGISFGADRIYDVMDALDLFPDLSSGATQLLFAVFGEAELDYALAALKKVRATGINAEIYPDRAKMAKQMKYADDKKIPYVAIIGSQEVEKEEITLKDMRSGDQNPMDLDKAIDTINNG